MITTKLRLATVIFSLTPTLCLAWGYDGHRIVGEIASNYLTPCAEEAVKNLLGDQTLADLANWAGGIKSECNCAKSTQYDHVTPAAGRFGMDRDCPEVGCVVSGIERHSMVLRSGGTPRRLEVAVEGVPGRCR